MSVKSTVAKTPRATQKRLSQLSPFELKDTLISLASENSKKATTVMLNAGRGNPNWIATESRQAFFTLGDFAIKESKRVWDEPGLGGMPQKQGIAARLMKYLSKHEKEPGCRFLKEAIDYGVDEFKFDPDSFVHELVDGVIGDNYPVPDRIMKHNERIVQAYLDQEMCGNQPPKGQFDLFAVEGGTAAMCYIFDSLMINRLLKKGDGIALAVPTFTPYIEIPELERYSFKVTNVIADQFNTETGRHTWQYGDKELEKLLNPKIKAFFLVNPSNPPSVAMSEQSLKKLVQIVKKKRPDLIIITDDVYGTFVPDFRSIMAELPKNTLGVYSFSKYFGCTGWRLGVIAVHDTNIFDERIAKLSVAEKKALKTRYESISLTPEKLKFVDRLVADSRQVALNHTAGLSLPQQVQMSFFALQGLMDKKNKYKDLTQHIIQRRLKALYKGMNIPLQADSLRAGYYADLDLMSWAEQTYGTDFTSYMIKNFEPVDILFRLAEQTSIVLLDGAGFAGPKWSVRVSLANLPDEAYGNIGQHLEDAAEEYLKEWKNSKEYASVKKRIRHH